MKNLKRNSVIKAFAVIAVSLMMLTALGVAIPSEDSDAASGGSYYKYVIHYTNENIDSVDVYTTKDGTVPKTITTGKDEFWEFKNGYGPFNSCYAAVDISTGQIAYHMEPDNLKRVLGSSNDLTSEQLSGYNIVWLIPTVYWKVDGNSLVLTNDIDGEEGFEAYMHTTTNGGNKIWKYVGIGVYEAASGTNGSKTVLLSQSGKSPLVSTTIGSFDTYAQNLPGDSILWNFYQWTFLKMATYMIGMGKNTQQIWGAGNTNSSAASQTGLGDSQGPYASGTTTYSKVFVENSWGSVWEWVGGTVFSSKKLLTERSTTQSTDYSTSGSRTSSNISLPSSGWITGTSKSSQYWDLPISSSSTSNATNTSVPGDSVYSNSGVRVLRVGGYWANTAYAGVASANASYDSTSSNSYVGGRLAYYFDADPASTPTVTISPNNSEYGTVTTESITVSEANAPLTVNGDTITIGTVGSVTAEPKPSTAEYTYGFSGWKLQNGNQLNNQTISGDLNIIAVFTATKNIYTVSLASNDLNYGGISSNSVSVEYGTAISSNGSTLSIGTNDIVATPTVSDAQYTYSFVDWSVNDGTVTGPMSITANFSRTINSYQITAQYSGDYGSVSPSSITVEYGSQIVPGANRLSIGSDTITFTPATGYTLDCWTLSDGSALPSTVTGPMTIIPNVIVRTITVTFMGGAGGSASELFEIATLKIPYGTTPMVFTPNLGDGVFQGWFTDSSLTQAFNTNTVLNDDLTLYCGATEYLKFTSSPIANGTLTTNSSLGMMIFDATGSESAYRVTWDFGDGTSSTDKVSYHMYTEPGRYKVTLSAYNYYGDVDVKEYTVVVSEGNDQNNLPIYAGAIIAVIVGLFVIIRFY